MISSTAGLKTSTGLLLYCLSGLLLSLFTSPANAARSVESKRECATCHIMWLEEFKRKDVITLIPYEPRPVTASGRQDVSSTERMCFSCHDGFVLDSRYMWQDKTHSHPVGIKPPKDMKIPTPKGKTVFPMNEDGNIYCGTCHTAHGVDWSSGEAAIFMRIKNIESSLCLACHLEKSTSIEEGNHPVFTKPGRQPDSLLEAGAKLAADGGVICESCHRPHGGEGQGMLVKANTKSALCVACHQEKRALIDSKHDMTLLPSKVTNIQGDDVGEKGPCSACHLTHNGSENDLWAQVVSATEDDKAAAKCVVCHSSEGIAANALTGIHSHPLNKQPETLGIKIDDHGWTSEHSWDQGKKLQQLPLFGSREMSCQTCHDPHNWSVKEALKNDPEVKNSDGDGNTSFLRIAQGKNSNLCINCHIDKRTVNQTSHNIEVDDNNKDSCAQCHAVHNAKSITLANIDLSQKEHDTSPIESWCKTCHQQNGLAKDKLIDGHSHPIGVRPQQMVKNSPLPLFDKEGKRNPEEGLLDCASCHNPHQWTPQLPKPLEIKPENVDGDGSNSYLRIRASNDSKLCVNCHQDNKMVLGTDHDLRVTSPGSKNASGQTVAQSGTCGQCHGVHNGLLKNNLWNQKLGPGQDLKEQQCRSCHNEDAIAEAKVPPELHHPADVIAWSAEIRQLDNQQSLPDVPVYNQEGEADQRGIISCTSCHNPHQWDPHSDVAGTGKKLEGSVLTSFLRNRDIGQILCADCHGKEALFRYKYYHSKTTHED